MDWTSAPKDRQRCKERWLVFLDEFRFLSIPNSLSSLFKEFPIFWGLSKKCIPNSVATPLEYRSKKMGLVL
jgi:hypothetical protein